MALDLSMLNFLQSARGTALLERLRREDLSEANTLRLITALRRDFGADEVGAALELARLRLRAVEKFGESAVGMYFTRDALEQASDPHIRAWRAAWLLSSVGDTQVADMGCGIGSDSIAFAQAGAQVVGYDLDPVRVACARLNAEALGVGERTRFEVADVRMMATPERGLVFFDPARRDEDGQRIGHVEQYQPPFSLVRQWLDAGLPVAAKVSPGVALDELKPYGGRVTFLSVDGTLKEAMWTNETAPLPAAVLFAHGQAHEWAMPPGWEEPPPSLSEPRAWLLEPDAALIRAGLVRAAGATWGAFQLDETIAYLTADQSPQTPWVRAWRVHEWIPFSVKRLRAALNARGVGAVTVKKRGSAITPEQLAAELRLKGDGRAGVVLTRMRGQQITMIIDEQPTQAGEVKQAE